MLGDSTAICRGCGILLPCSCSGWLGSRTNYQLKWSVYRQWCRSVGHSISRSSLPKFARYEYCRMIDYICGLFPQAVGVPPSAPPPRALFESFFAPATPATPSIQRNWFDRVRASLMEADSRVASILSSGRPERIVLPQRLPSFAVKGDCTLGRVVPVNESLLSHFERPLRPNLQLGITIRDAMAVFPCTVRGSLICHVGPLGFVRVCPPARFYSR